MVVYILILLNVFVLVGLWYSSISRIGMECQMFDFLEKGVNTGNVSGNNLKK